MWKIWVWWYTCRKVKSSSTKILFEKSANHTTNFPMKRDHSKQIYTELNSLQSFNMTVLSIVFSLSFTKACFKYNVIPVQIRLRALNFKKICFLFKFSN